MEYKSVVTSFLQADQRILLLRRSTRVGTHKGKWAAVSGYLEGSETPLQRAQTEIREEVGIESDQISLIRAGEALRAFDEQTAIVWTVYPFLFEALSREIRLGWENTEYKWIEPYELGWYATVPKLKETFDRVNCNLQLERPSLARVLLGVEDLAQDRVHGASFLGGQALELLSAVTTASEVNTSQELFCDLLRVASKLSAAQPGMANIRNLIGMLLYDADLGRAPASAPEFRILISGLAKALIEHAQDAVEDASRNAVALLPADGNVLTHSYSSAVLRTLELGMMGRREFQVYATESYPGMEGKQLAKELVEFGVPVKLVPDSGVGSIIPDLDLVLVGADSVLADGSLLHKIGTRGIARAANERDIPFYSVCETTKFSTANFLKEPVQASEAIFDLSPSKYVWKFITEVGPVDPPEVESRIRLMLREIYP